MTLVINVRRLIGDNGLTAKANNVSFLLFMWLTKSYKVFVLLKKQSLGDKISRTHFY